MHSRLSRRDFLQWGTLGMVSLVASGCGTGKRKTGPVGLPVSTATPVASHGRREELSSEPPLTSLGYELPQKKPDLFGELIGPFVEEAQKRREERTRTDLEFARRVDIALNRGRVNFLLFGYGETHEPPRTERAMIGSHTVVSYGTWSRRLDFVSLTHDIRAPEIERYKRTREAGGRGAIKIDHAHKVGGFELMRQVLESATGLSVDFQVVFKDTLIKDLVNQVFNGVELEVPFELHTNPFYLEGVKYERGHFAAGRQRLDGTKVIQFIKTVPIEAAAHQSKPDKLKEHNARKHLVFEALLDSLKENCDDPLFWAKALWLLGGETIRGKVTYDFDIKPLLLDTIGGILAVIGEPGNQDSCEMAAVSSGRKVYIVDSAHGDGGVCWVRADPNPITARDIQAGVYPDLAMAVPLGADPYAEDLVNGYWQSVRRLVKESLADTEN